MNLKDFHNRKINEFISIDSVVNCIVKTDALPLKDAILSLYSLLKSEDDWSYIYRNESTLIAEGECLDVHEYPQYEGDSFSNSQQACLSALLSYSRCFEEPNYFKNQLIHTGWYKSEIKHIFNENSLQYLDCFDDDFYSPDFYLGSKAMQAIDAEVISENIEPDWEYYAKLPYLTEKECACLLENVNPELYSVVELDHNGHLVSEEYKVPNDVVKKVQKSLEVIKRHSNLGLSSTGQAEWVDGRHQFTFFKDTFVEWATVNDLELNPVFLSTMVKPSQSGTPEYLDTDHPCYSPKLAAAIEAWQFAVSRHGESQKTPTQNIEKWLADNENTLNFNQSKQTVDSIARIANFRSKSSSMTGDEMKEAKAKLKEYNSKNIQKISEKYIDRDPVPF